MSTSSVRSEMGGRSMVVPCIRCLQCRTRVKFYLSNTERHEGWVFYKCVNHRVTCEFWHWELEYVVYLVENRYLEGNEAVDVIGAAEDRREELNREANGRASGRAVGAANGFVGAVGMHGRNEEWVPSSISRQQADALVGLGREMVMLLKALIASVMVMCVLMGFFIMKN